LSKDCLISIVADILKHGHGLVKHAGGHNTKQNQVC
jgi:hypothetical protein